MLRALICLAILAIFANSVKAQDNQNDLFDVYDNLEGSHQVLMDDWNFTICLEKFRNICLYATPQNKTVYWANNYNPTDPLYGFIFAVNYTQRANGGVFAAIRKPGCSQISAIRDTSLCGIDVLDARTFRNRGDIYLQTNINPKFISNFAYWDFREKYYKYYLVEVGDQPSFIPDQDQLDAINVGGKLKATIGDGTDLIFTRSYEWKRK